KDHKDIAQWLCTLFSSYQIRYADDGKLIPYVANIKTLLQDNNIEEIRKLADKSGAYHTIDNCMVCLEDNCSYWIKLDCNHEICSSCFIKIDRCPLRCKSSIDLNLI